MKILVPVKRCIDFNARVRVKADHTGVETNHVKHSMNPFCEIAITEAVAIKAKHQTCEIITISIGENKAEEILRQALALGADRAILIASQELLFPLQIAKILKYFAIKEEIDLIVMGKQSIDGDNNQTGQILAGLLNWPQASFASKIILDSNNVTVTSEVDSGLKTLELNLPAVITCDLRLNTPGYATLPNIIKAKQKPLLNMSLSDLDIYPEIKALSNTIEILEVTSPEARAAGMIVDSVDILLEKLHNEAQVI